MNNRVLLRMCAAALLLLSACTKVEVEPDLPPVTQEGKNTFGCEINGEAWTPRVTNLLMERPAVGAYLYQNNEGGLSGFIEGNRYDRSTVTQGSVTLHFITPALEPVRLYAGAQPENLDRPFCEPAFHHGPTVFRADTTQVDSSNYIDIQFIDTTRRIVAGEFQFTLSRTDAPGETLEVRKGRFDVQYSPQ